MSKYIEADALKANCYIIVGDTTIGWRDYVTFHEIDSAPSIDIVFCKECKHRIRDDDFQEKRICLLRRANGGKFCKDNDFCSYGEREDK